MKKEKVAPLNALVWIVGSILLVSGSVFFSLHFFFKWQKEYRAQPRFFIKTLVQTGPKKNALTSEYLAELMGLSVDQPTNIFEFNEKTAEEALKSSPVIKEANVRRIKPNTIYIDYVMREPKAWLYEYENTAIDEEGYLFPVYPFFSPKELPELHLGLFPFMVPPKNSDLPVGKWHIPLSGKYVSLGLDLLKQTQGLNVLRIDASKAYAPTLGSREIVLYFEDEIILKNDQKEHLCIFPRLVRLSTKNYKKELHYYRELRTEMLANEKKGLALADEAPYFQPFPLKIVDLRMEGIGFVETKKEPHSLK